MIEAPKWIQEHVKAHGGGWAHPVKLTPGHTALTETGSSCFDCAAELQAGDIVIPMPFADADGKSRWILTHRDCLLRALGCHA